jgi:hypothetical protein
VRITDELWEYANKAIHRKDYMLGLSHDLLCIADRIDEEHERITHNLTDALHKQEDATRELDEKSVLLPMDADGEAIHVGDTLTDGEYTFRVCELVQFADGSWSIRNECGNAWAACDVTHHHKPTVEDVLREFSCVLMGKREFDGDVTKAVAEYAKRLRLRED